VEELVKARDRDFYLSAEEAKDFGVVDEIMTKPPGAEGEDDE
jgi:ATP-dependent Clp protease protease subunit